MVLGNWSRKDTLYGEGYSVTGNGDLAEQLREAIAPTAGIRSRCRHRPFDNEPRVVAFTPPPPDRHITEGSFFIDDHRAIRQIVDGKAEPVVYGGKTLTAYGTHDRQAPRRPDRPARQPAASCKSRTKAGRKHRE